MRFSVVIPVYNAENTIRRCLNSLLDQNYEDYEIVLVNDGSKDRSGELCQEYAARFSNVKYIAKENGGVSSARNAGLDAAEGEYILFVDSDDYVLDKYFETLEQNASADYLVFDIQRKRNSHQEDKTLRWQSSEAMWENILQLVTSRGGGPWNKRFRGSVIREHEIRFPEDLNVGEDFIFCLRYLCCSAHSEKCDHVLYCLDESSDHSLTRGYHPDSAEQALRIYRYAFSAIDGLELTEQQKHQLQSALDYNYYRTAFACIKDLLEQKENSFFCVRKPIKQIQSRFWEDRHGFPKAQGKVHRYMRWCIRTQNSFLAYLICAGHKQYSKVKR